MKIFGEVAPEGYGMCYVRLFKDGWRQDVSSLGPCPTVRELRVYTNTFRDRLASGAFKVSLTFSDCGVVAHVERGTEEGDGVSADAVLACLDKSTRVGMSTAEPVVGTNDQRAIPIRGARMELEAGMVFEREIMVGFAIDHSTSDFSFKPRDDPVVRRLGQMFTSVKLMDASFTIQVTGDNTSHLKCAVTNDMYLPQSNYGWVKAPVNAWAIGNAQGATRTVLELTREHKFGREILAPALGIGDPVFHFSFVSSVQALAICTGRMRLQFGGDGFGPCVDMARYAGRKGATSGMALASRAEAEDEEESSDEEVKQKPGPASPSAANRGVVRK